MKDWKKVYSGKVRELYAPSSGPQDIVLVVATDRLSAFDKILDSEIPEKGIILTQLSLWWFNELDIDNHVLSTEVPAEVAGRAMVCRRLNMSPIECIARGYLTGSALKEYNISGTVHGQKVASGLVDGSAFETPLFTPSTKAEVGDHDENISYQQMEHIVGTEQAEQLKELSLDIYNKAARITKKAGILLADTKFEFGQKQDGHIVLGDEILTPDSSRFWDATQYQPGKSQQSFDKQYVRDWLQQAPEGTTKLPEEVIAKTRQRYIEAYERITGKSF
ncbi:MAG: phosphoribosylaminoimidazolesuccinocarboxamide synthase [Micrococcaceae bacterium]